MCNCGFGSSLQSLGVDIEGLGLGASASLKVGSSICNGVLSSCKREHALLILPTVACIALLRSNAVHRFLAIRASI